MWEILSRSGRFLFLLSILPAERQSNNDGFFFLLIMTNTISVIKSKGVRMEGKGEKVCQSTYLGIEILRITEMVQN